MISHKDFRAWDGDKEKTLLRLRAIFSIGLAAGIILVADLIYLVSKAWRYREPAVLDMLCVPLLFVPLTAFICMRLWSHITQWKYE